MPFISGDLPPHVFIIPTRYKEDLTLSSPLSLLVKVLPGPPTQAGERTVHLITRGEKTTSLIRTLAKCNRLFGQKQAPLASPPPPPETAAAPPETAAAPPETAAAPPVETSKAEKVKGVPYSQLVCTEVDKQNIAYIIQTMATNGKLSLLFKQSELRRIGAEINHVHPLKFLETIFANPELKACMLEISNDYFKWNGFLDGLIPSLTNQANQGKLSQYIKEFAKRTNNDPKELTPYFQSQDWENLIRYLMNHSEKVSKGSRP